jgi:peptidoglycan/xylan/chitin deacetylase (PgdA/CDA1 family)
VLKKEGIVVMWSRNFNSKDSREWVKGEWFERGSKIDVDSKEFKNKTHEIYNRIIANLKGKGIVILFHDTHLTSVKVLPELIQKLISLGYHFATLEDYVQWRWKASSRELLKIK